MRIYSYPFPPGTTDQSPSLLVFGEMNGLPTAYIGSRGQLARGANTTVGSMEILARNYASIVGVCDTIN